MIEAILVDDEKGAIRALKNDLSMYCPTIHVAAVFTKPAEALSYLKTNKVEVIFLDIDMPVMNGFDFAAQLDRRLVAQIIFVTAYSEFALRAFKVDALDYLLKPVDPDDLRLAVEKLQQRIEPMRAAIRPLSTCLSANQTAVVAGKIALPVNNGFHLVDPTRILYCKATGAYTEIVVEGEKSLLISKNIGRVQELLPVQLFERVHQSYLVNLCFVKKFRKGDAPTAVMVNEDVIKISRQNKDRVAQLLGIP